MKTDNLSFTFVTAICLAGVIIAIASPAQPKATAASTPVQPVLAHVVAPADNVDALDAVVLGEIDSAVSE